MRPSEFDRSASAFVGDLAVAPDGAVDGFCGDPARPDLRCFVEILVEGRIAATVLAREPRGDLADRGFADTAHGFRATLALPARPEVMVWARVRGARRGFAQRLLVRPGLPACPPERERALAAQVARLSAGLAALSQAQSSPWSDACRDLARLLAGEAA